MSVYAIIFSNPNDDSWNIIQDKWPSHYKANANLVFITSDDQTLTTASIASNVGMNNQNKEMGVVLQVGHYYGYESPELWEWLGKFT